MSSNRSPEMQAITNELAKAMSGRTQEEASALGVCVTCGEPVTGFRDALSEKEYQISGMCQKCQDSVFGKENDER